MSEFKQEAHQQMR